VSAPADIPIFPLNTVLFPDGLLPLRVFETRYMDMTRERMKRNLPFGVCLIKEGKEVGAPAIAEETGCLARIVEWDMQQLGVLHLRNRGEQRFRITGQTVSEQGLITASVEMIPEDDDCAVPASFAACAQLLQMVVADKDAGVFAQPHRFDSATWVGNRLAEIVPVPPPARQKLLELTDSLVRLEILHKFLAQRGVPGFAAG
jgi:Lon protease-like protein